MAGVNLSAAHSPFPVRAPAVAALLLLAVAALACGSSSTPSGAGDREGRPDAAGNATTADASDSSATEGGTGGAPVSDGAGLSDAAPGPDVTATDGNEPDTGGVAPVCPYALCENFESYQDGDLPDPAVWAQQATKARVGSAFAARGSKALHIPAFTKDKVQIRETKTFPALGKAFFARVYLYVDQMPTEAPSTLYHWTLIEASETPDDSGHRVRLGGHIEKSVGPTDWLRFNYETGTSAGETGLSDPTSVIEPKKWYCIEVYFDMATSEARIWLDDVERTKLHWQNNMPGAFSFPAAIQSLSFGWVEYQPPVTPWEVWLDEIAVDGQRIGCVR